MTDNPKRKVMNLNSLLMGADNIKPSQVKAEKKSAAFVTPPTMKSLGNLESTGIKPKDVKQSDSGDKIKQPSKIAQGLKGLFDKADATEKAQDDTGVKPKTSGFGKMSPGFKRPKTAKVKSSRPQSAFGKQPTARDSDDSRSESEYSKSGSSSRSGSQTSDDDAPPTMGGL